MIVIRHKYSNPTGLLIAGIILTAIGIIGLILIIYFYVIRKPRKVLKVIGVQNGNTCSDKVITSQTKNQITPKLYVVESGESKLQPEVLMPIKIPA